MSKSSDFSFIYLIGSERGQGPFKVGISTRPEHRAKQLQTAYPRPVAVHGAWQHSNPRAVEAETHRLLAPWHMSGEWFDVSRNRATAAIMQAILHVDSNDGGHHDAKNSDRNNCAARLLGRCLRPEFPAQAAGVSRRGDELGARRGAALRLRADGRREMVQHSDYIGARRLCDAAGAGRIEETQNADRVYRSPADKRVRAITGDKGVGDRLLTRPAAVIRVRRRNTGTPASSRSPG
jgi:hypothetical protein